MKLKLLAAFFCFAAVAFATNVNGAVIRPGFNAAFLAANDDFSTGQIPLGFTANFFGTPFTQAYLNNNGNMTFAASLFTFTPFGLTSAIGNPIIAPFFGDVDTRGLGSDLLRYGVGVVGGRAAFGATWDGAGVGYFPSSVDLLNKFQVVLVDRSDVAPGDFDIEFNYDQIQWETGSASGGINGFGGSSARAGFSNGSGIAGTNFELAGSGVTLAFVDSGPAATRLISNRFGSSIDRGAIDGQYVFQARNGSVNVVVPEPASIAIWSFISVACFSLTNRRRSAVSRCS